MAFSAEPREIFKLARTRTAGIHIKGGTILKTTNKANLLIFRSNSLTVPSNLWTAPTNW